MLVLALSLFLADPAPLDMPRATAFLVEGNGVRRLEDRYDRTDLWLSQSVIGRWVDDDRRVFTLVSLDSEPPMSFSAQDVLTRTTYAESRRPMKRIRANGGFPQAFRRAIELVSGAALCEGRPRAPRQLPHGYRDVCYWQHPTNDVQLICTFRQEKAEQWYLATWEFVEGDDPLERQERFEDVFLRREFGPFIAAHLPPPPPSSPSAPIFERELLRADVRHSVGAYADWHFTDSDSFAVIDDLPTREPVALLTNEFAVMRARYAAALPTPVDGSNVLGVARIYASRAEYLFALEVEGRTNLNWSAAYWSPLRRELVACLPEQGEMELVRTIRHEAFHQYLSYAASMMPTSPWLNEGYAQFFEEADSEDWEIDVDLSDEGLDRLARLIPGLLGMDYDRFYAGSDGERRLKYRLAWSLAVFLEKGADKVRFRPFAKLKHDYFETLLSTGDMRKATSAALRDADTLELFTAEWKKFWKSR